MYKKLCTRCYKASFSSTADRLWKRPICQQDLTKAKSVTAGNKLSLSIQYKKYQQKFNKSSLFKDSTFSYYV
ncbi:hypothetical protein [Metabacillus arenae]|uniref:Uncharacterized protein n=1 Tax=Metabacillus arenae TaxID=2771434 RepID=A0A926NDG5_9BACI|nr:hypothetical protein [Metabacillus arenae]MBD1378825.1 hypothetical protein [Metabacillus arenae]